MNFEYPQLIKINVTDKKLINQAFAKYKPRLLDIMATNGGADDEDDQEKSRRESLFLPPIKEQESPDINFGDDSHTKPRQRPFSLSPRRLKPNSPPDSSSDEEDYVEGVIGTTPPRDQRLTKTRRKNKWRRTSSPYQESRDKQKQFLKSRHQSADWILLDPPMILTPNNQPRRHTLSDTSVPIKKTFGFKNYSSFEESSRLKREKDGGKKDKEGGKKKKDIERKQDRDEKHTGHHPSPLPPPNHVPMLNITSPMSELPRSFTDTPPLPSSLPKHPLLTSLTSNDLSSRMASDDDEGRPRMIRSHSDAQFSLTLSSNQSVRCPSDRNKFYKNFRKTLSVLSKRQQQGPLIHQAGFHVPRQHSENLSIDNPFGHIVDQIWIELRAWQAERTPEEQEDWDFDHHREVDKVLDRVMKYRFDTQSNELDVSFITGTEREREEYEPLMSLKSIAKNDENGDENSEETTPLGSLKTNMGQVHFEEDDVDEAPKTLTQQGSTDSEESSTTCSSKSSGEYSVDKFHSAEQLSALSQVEQLLEDLENVESLYSNSRKIGDENSKYRQQFFRRKRDALILWVKVTKGLANHLSRLSKWFGVPIFTQLVPTPSTPSRTTSDGTSSSHPLSGFSLSDLSTDPEASLGGLSRLSSIAFLSQSSQISSVSSKSTSNPRPISHADSCLSTCPSSWKGYRKFVDRTLKKKGLKWLIDELIKFIAPIFKIAEEAIKVRGEEFEESFTDDEDIGISHTVQESWPLLPYAKLHPEAAPMAPQVSRLTSSTPRCWLDEIYAMNLPSFAELVSK